ncbi:unnamed protein product [Miscanthus lutarioriparius]|uniref:Bidirectional sugar transporter SWEET n=1 Tax=Miscanthus lutarioriparius TaxID=422564 RepID=A0A811Q6G1_9POAL|nr:unnamed protein product [Miscanthus lutarioriparius]
MSREREINRKKMYLEVPPVLLQPKIYQGFNGSIFQWQWNRPGALPLPSAYVHPHLEEGVRGAVYSPVPYVATLLNCMMWVLYGLPAVHPHSMLVITINGTGVAIEVTYITLFLLYSTGATRRRVLLQLAAEVAFVGAVAALVLNLAHTYERRSMVVGILCVLFGTGMYAAPLSVMYPPSITCDMDIDRVFFYVCFSSMTQKMVIKTKSVEYMPLFLSLASLVNGICWTAYALIRFDLYITVPNGLGVLFALAQLVLYAIYYKSPQEIIEARKRKADQVAMTEIVVDGKPSNAGHY